MYLYQLLYVTIYLFYMYIQFDECGAGTVTYINIERPVITYFNKKYLSNCTLKSQRVSRHDPRYYVNFYFDIVVPVDNKFKIDMYFCEYIQTNRYRRSFIEFHFKVCDFIEKDQFFGPPLKKSLDLMNRTSCPYPAGEYYFVNMSLPFVPQWIPFPRGRIYCNISLDSKETPTAIGSGHLDIEVKSSKVGSKN